MGCSFLTTAYHGHLLPSSSWTSLLSPCKAILESSWEHLMCNLMINWCLRTWCILVYSWVMLEWIKYQASWTNQMSLGFFGYKRCLLHTSGYQTSWLSTEWILQFHLTRWNFACPYHPSDNINILNLLNKNTVDIYIYIIYNDYYCDFCITYIHHTYRVALCSTFVLFRKNVSKKPSIPCFLQPISSSWRPIQSAKGKADGSKLQQGSACSWCRSPMFCLLDSPCRFIL